MNYSKIKKSHKDEANQKARFFLKLEEYKKLSLDELKEIYKTKISSTDKTALIHAANALHQAEMDKITNMKILEDNIEGE
jgi:hypothetical protein